MKLDIQKFAISKSTSFSESNLNVEANTSSLTITIYFSANNNVTCFSSEPLNCTCNGVTQTANVKHPKGGSVTKSFTFNNIQHNADGTKTVSWSWNCNTGTSVLGNVSASGTRKLTDLHTPPEISSYTITETNQDLVNAGVSNDLFVANLSKKSVNISYNLFDDSTLQRATAFNHTTAYSNTTLPILMDFTQNPLVLSPRIDTGVTGVPFLVRIEDSLNGLRFFTNTYGNFTSTPSSGEYRDFYNYILYLPISFTSTTKARRVGQLSGQVAIDVEGSYFDGIVGNIDQSSYKPTIKYKYWKYGDSEPSTYSNIIPAQNITVSNGTFSVNSFNIGSTTETDTNYFAPEYAWRIKLYVEDNFTNSESNELSITIGEATWTEYKDRVDFKKITLKNEIDVYDELFYKAGDQIQLGELGNNKFYINTGFVSSSTTILYFTFTVPKSLDNVTSVTVTSFNTKVRGTQGYLNNYSSYGEFVGATNYSLDAVISDSHSITVRLIKASAWTNVSNNTPVILEGSFIFTVN